jgi:hypothetical protein
LIYRKLFPKKLTSSIEDKGIMAGSIDDEDEPLDHLLEALEDSDEEQLDFLIEALEDRDGVAS